MSAPSRRRAAIQQLLAAYSSVLLNIVNGIVLVPLYFHFFDVATYGSWLACQNIVTWLGLVELGFNLVFTHRLVHDNASRERFPETVGSGLALTATTSAAAAVVGGGLALAGTLWMPFMLGATAENMTALRWGLLFAAVGVALTMMQAAFTAIAASWMDAGRTGAIGVVALACGIGTTLIGLFAGAGVTSLGLAALVRGVVGAGASGVYIAVQYRKRQLPSMRVTMDTIRGLLRTLAFPGVARVLSTVASNSESTVAAAIVGPTAAAMLGLSSRLYDVARVLLVPISYSVFSPFADVALRDGKQRAHLLYRELIGMVLGASALLLAPAIAVNASFVQVWLGSQVFVGQSMSVALALATLAYTFANLQNVLIAALGRIREGAIINMADTLIRVVALVALTSTISYAGIPAASIIASVVSIGLCYRQLAKGLDSTVLALVPVPRVIALAAALISGYVAALYVPPARDWPHLIMIATAAGTTALAYTVATNPELRHHMRALLQRLTGARRV